MFSKNNILLGVTIIVAFLCSFSSFIVFRAIVALCLVFLAFSDKFFLAYPIVLFFYTQFGLFAGLSILRLYSLLLFLNYLILNRTRKELKVYYSDFFLFAVYFVYVILVLTMKSYSLGISTLLNVISIGILAFFYLKDTECLKSFFKIYTIVALLSIPAGINQANNMINHQFVNGEMVETSRFMGTFDDPNYLTFFCYIAIISLLTLKSFNKWVRWIMIFVFQICIFSTLSITGIVCGAIIWMVYLVLEQKISLRYLFILPCICLCFMWGYNYGIQHQDAPILGDLAFRLSQKVTFLNTGDIAGITTGRSSYSEMHFQYFWNQNIGRIICGGNLANTKIMQVGDMRFAAHNEYVDILLNIGILGAMIYFYCIIQKIVRLYRIRQVNDSMLEYCNCLIMVKVVWFLYAMTLTMFLEERFLLFIFL